MRDDCASATLAAAHKPCNVTTRYTYDRAGNRTAITDARNHTRTFAYTAADELRDEVDALGRRITYGYDRQGHLVAQEDGRGAAAKQTLAYDAVGRLTTITASGLTAPITQAYDARGQRTSLTDATGTTTFRYDAVGRLTGVTAPQTGNVGYGYTARGERASLTYPDGV